MRNLKIVIAALTVSTSSLALAQDRPAPPADSNFGTQVSAQARAQREGDNRGLGAEVSVLARQQGELRRTTREPGEEDGDAVDVEDGEGDGDGTAGSSQGIGSQVSVLARGQRDGEERGIGEQVRALTPAAERSNRDSRRTGSEDTQVRSRGARNQAEAVAAARGSNREIRTGGGAVADLRSSVANSRSAVAGTRADVAATRAQANAARQDARAAAQQARQVRETVRAARPGRRP